MEKFIFPDSKTYVPVGTLPSNDRESCVATMRHVLFATRFRDVPNADDYVKAHDAAVRQPANDHSESMRALEFGFLGAACVDHHVQEALYATPACHNTVFVDVAVRALDDPEVRNHLLGGVHPDASAVFFGGACATASKHFVTYVLPLAIQTLVVVYNVTGAARMGVIYRLLKLTAPSQADFLHAYVSEMRANAFAAEDAQLQDPDEVSSLVEMEVDGLTKLYVRLECQTSKCSNELYGLSRQALCVQADRRQRGLARIEACDALRCALRSLDDAAVHIVDVTNLLRHLDHWLASVEAMDPPERLVFLRNRLRTGADAMSRLTAKVGGSAYRMHKLIMQLPSALAAANHEIEDSQLMNGV